MISSSSLMTTLKAERLTSVKASLWDVVVVGAGPAGAAAATKLGKNGLRVLLLDREDFPRPKVCGCCLSPLALNELNILSHQSPSPLNLQIQPLSWLTVASKGHSTCLPYTTGGFLSRLSLDTQLATHAVASGTTWLPNTRALNWHSDDKRILLTIETDGVTPYTIQTQRLLLATGLHNTVRCNNRTEHLKPTRPKRPPNNRIGIGATLPANAGRLSLKHLIMAIGDGGYCGLIRLEDNTIDVAAALHPSKLRIAGSPAKALTLILSQAFYDNTCPIDLAKLQKAPIRATPQLTHHTGTTDSACDRVFRIGDAVGYIEPFTGEGIGWSLLSSRLATDALVTEAGSLRPADEATARYHHTYHSALSKHHRRCRLVSCALRSPWLVSTSIQLSNKFPRATRSVAGLITGSSLNG